MVRSPIGRVLGIAALLTAIAGLGGCSRSSESANPAASGTRARVPLKEVRIGYFANLTHAQAVLGVASGDFERAVSPARVTGQVFNAGPSLIEALFAGEVDIGFVGPGPAINAYSRTKGQGIRVIAGAAANGVVIVVRPDAGIETLEDIKGKRIATPQLGNTQDISARHYLTARLGQTDLDNVVPIANGEQLSLMMRKQIDVAWAPEPWGARLVAEAGGRILTEERFLWPHGEFGLTVIVSTPEFLAVRPDVVKQVLAVSRSWTAKLNADAARYVSDLAAALTVLTGKKMPEELLGTAIKRVTFTDEPLEETLDTMAQWSYELKFLKDQVNLKGLVDTTLLRELRDTQPSTSRGSQ